MSLDALLLIIIAVLLCGWLEERSR
jgi:hypothetical protein